MQKFTFTLDDSGSLDSYISAGLPSSTTTVELEGEIDLTTLCNYFTQFVRGCGYVLPENSKIAVVDEEY